MTATEILVFARGAGIVLEVHGEKLHVEAPVGVLTPELRQHLVQQKPALIALLTPPYVILVGGLAVPPAALLLAFDLEARGIALTTDADHQFIVPADPRLSAADQTAIRRWHQHLGALIEYRAPQVG